MKYIPNLLTLCNLIFGCFAIAFTLSAPSYLNTSDDVNYFPVLGIQEIQWGSICIFIAAFFDVLDGLAARVLKAHSSIGKDLDSLADMVSFGVAPSMILYQFIWCSYMAEPGALDTPMWVLVPAFGVAVFAALRLAVFNQTAAEQTATFKGLPVPAVGILVACLPLVAMYQSSMQELLLNRWYLYIFVAILCFLMVSNIRFFKWQGKKSLSSWMPQILVAVAMIAGIALLGIIGVYVGFVVYVLLSIFYTSKNQ